MFVRQRLQHFRTRATSAGRTTLLRCNSIQTTKQGIATMAPEAQKNVTLVSFDVDGTLIESIGTNANKLHKDAFAHAFKAVFGIDTHIDVVKHHGSTDPLIVIKVMEHHGIPKDQV